MYLVTTCVPDVTMMLLWAKFGSVYTEKKKLTLVKVFVIRDCMLLVVVLNVLQL